MQRFFFNLRLQGDYVPDPEGEELADLEEARFKAIKAAKELLAERILTGKPSGDCQLEISDDSGRVLAAVPFLGVL
jgi:hypothetical protein